MSENRAPETGAEVPAVPGVDVKIYLPKDPDKDHGKLMGFASVNLGGVFAVNNIRIYNANQGLKAREGGRKTAQKSRECKYVANKSHNTLLRCLRQ